MTSKEEIEKWIEEHRGVLTAKSAIVHRDTYFGNDVIAKNSSTDFADERGYVPVEMWIMSAVQAENLVEQEGEGMTQISIEGSDYTLAELKDKASSALFGDYGDSWPLTKILDIGGNPVTTSFGTEEVPPIPVHFHPQKTEAYFFPPTELPPYNKKIDAITRIGLKDGVSKDDFLAKLKEFGTNDEMFTLLNEFKIEPLSGWTVLEKVLHAPGPYITFEIQRPRDDYHLASWMLGERLEEDSRKKKYEKQVIRDAKDEDDYIENALNWERTSDQKLHDTFFHKPKILDEGSWGKRYQIFFDMFYGEGWEINPGETLTLEAKETPQAGIVWSGEAGINGNAVKQNGKNEFLAVPNTKLEIKNTGDSPLFIYTVEPILPT